MKKIIYIFAVIFICTANYSPAQQKSSTNPEQEKISHPDEPSLSLVEAVKLAKDYIEENKIDITRHYLDNARLLQNSPWMQGKHWVIEWRLKNAYVDGGMIFVIVGMDEKIKITYGE